MSSALSTLERFAAKQASTHHEVMRALAEHPDYFVPISFAPRLDRSEFERILMISKSGGRPPGALYVFTYEEIITPPSVSVVVGSPASASASSDSLSRTLH